MLSLRRRALMWLWWGFLKNKTFHCELIYFEINNCLLQNVRLLSSYGEIDAFSVFHVFDCDLYCLPSDLCERRISPPWQCSDGLVWKQETHVAFYLCALQVTWFQIGIGVLLHFGFCHGRVGSRSVAKSARNCVLEKAHLNLHPENISFKWWGFCNGLCSSLRLPPRERHLSWLLSHEGEWSKTHVWVHHELVHGPLNADVGNISMVDVFGLQLTIVFSLVLTCKLYFNHHKTVKKVIKYLVYYNKR